MRDRFTEDQRMTEPAVVSATAPAHRSHDSGLLMIGLFKLGKAIFFFFVGLGAIHLLHKDLAEEVRLLAQALHRDPEGRLVNYALDKVGLLDVGRLRWISAGSFGYAVLSLTEGTGLMLEKVWAEYLTLTLTVSLLPWEIFELVRDATSIRAGLLIANLIVLAYLIWYLQRKKKNTAQVPQG